MRSVVVRPPVPGVELCETPPPAMGPGSVRVSVLECGVCGTDHDIVAGKYGSAPSGAPYLILGHENLGEVRAVAPGVTGFAPGDLVVATVRRGCGRCRFCRSNRSDFCETGLFTERGIGGAHGYMAEEYVEVPEYLLRVPAALRPVAVLLEPLSVVEKAVFQGQRVLDRKEPTPGQPKPATPSALVAGTGAIGMLAALVLRLRGYEVMALDRHGEETPAAAVLARAGATHANVAPGMDALAGHRFDLVVEATGSVALDFSLVDRLGPNGVLVLTGIPDAAGPATPVAGGTLLREVVLGNQAIVGSVNANRTYFESGLRDLTVFEERWPGAVGQLLSRRRPIEEYETVLTNRVPGTIKTVLMVRSGGALA
ncbi:MAG: glucose 1-dehydrogenase [Thermoplasmata archaeon]|jgi:threonine dehydrogenase-like Zn-dependent dehydrogenase